MSNTITDSQKKSNFTNAGLKLLLHMVITGTLITALLFLSAGRLDWVQGWVFVVLWFVTKLSYVALVAKYDPELTAERSSRHKNTQTYDRVLMTIYLLLVFAGFVVAGLEVRFYPQHFELTSAAILMIIVGLAAHLVMNGLAMWAMLTNTYHSAESRLQSERSQMVITEGPYRFIRHPTYFATVAMWLTTPLILGSSWAFFNFSLASDTRLPPSPINPASFSVRKMPPRSRSRILLRPAYASSLWTVTSL